MKRTLTLIAVAAVSLIALSGCYHSVGDIDGLELYTNKSKKDAFVGVYFWDGDANSTTIVIPDEYEGCAVTAFGGSYDIGVPVGFDVIYRTESLISENVSLQAVIQNENGEFIIRLNKDEPAQAAMQRITACCKVDSVRIYEPSLNDIFVEFAGDQI